MSNPPQKNRLETRNFAQLAGELLDRAIAVRFTARGRSMQPFLVDGDILTVEPFRDRAPGAGEIILHADAGGRAVAHRVLRRTRDGTVLMIADAARRDSDPVPATALLGRIVRVEREGTARRPARAAGLVWYLMRPLRRAVNRVRSLMRPPRDQ